MENIRNMSKWGLILIAVLFLMPQVSHAAGKTVDSTQCTSSPIYDLTGTYDDSMFDSSAFSITVVQDGKGKLSGDGHSSFTITDLDLGDYGYWDVDFDFDYVVKGAVTSNQKFSLSIKLINGTAFVGDLGVTAQFSASESVKGQIMESQSGPVLSGTGKAKGCIKKVGCTSEPLSIYEPLDDPDNGIWTLTFDADKGEGELVLFNGKSFPFAVKGKQNVKKGESTFSLKGIDASTGCSLKGKFDENGNSLISLKGKVLGQKIDCQ